MTHERLHEGTRVRTVKHFSVEHEMREWTAEAQCRRKWGVVGTVINHHDSHGLCYDVRHDDGTVGCYEPEELQVRV